MASSSFAYATDIPSLERTRGGYKGQVTTAISILEGHETAAKPFTLEEGENMLQKLQRIEARNVNLSDIIFQMCTTADETDKAVKNAEEFDQKIIKVISRLQIIIQSLTPRPAPPVTIPPVTENHVKLPTLELPTFDGKFENWQSFQDLFHASVESKTSLRDSQKLQYLKSCVKGDAANLIKSFTVTDAHFQEAWDLLKERYDNKREIVNSLISRIFKQANINQESATSIQRILDVTTESLRSLKVLGRPTEEWDDLIVFFIVDKLDPETRREWAMSLKGSDPPTFKALQDFLELYVRGLQAGGMKASNFKPHSINYGGERKSTQSSHSHHSANLEQPCPLCKQNHSLFQCQQFRAMSPEDRISKTKSLSACLNCLRSGHIGRDCSSQSTCRRCGKRHHTLLHCETKKNSSQTSHFTACNAAKPAVLSPVPIATSSIPPLVPATQKLLKTALVKILDASGRFQTCRAFLDDGSESSFISEHCASSLGLKKVHEQTRIKGLMGGKLGVSKAKVNITLSSLFHNLNLSVEALVVPKVTAPMPRQPFEYSSWAHIQGLELADPNFNKPSKIDMLISGDVIAQLLLPGIKKGEENQPIAQNTLLGWVVLGKTEVPLSSPVVRVHYQDTDDNADLDKTLARFWEIEELPQRSFLSPEETDCENHFHNYHTRDKEGRYTVKLPFKSSLNNLGSSREQALRRLYSLEKRFQKFPEHREEYVKFMTDYESQGHMKVIPVDNLNKPNFYLPHHFVIKESSSTTKFRVVFDGSAKSSSGLSLNNSLMVGATIQDDLFTLLLRFRTYPVALKADIAKMYRQFRVDEEDSHYQRILWRYSPDQPIRDYQLKTITYGTSSAPFQATRCLKQLALDEKSDFPLASQIIQQDMYVDDLLSGAATPQEAILLQKQIVELVSKGGMTIRKWMTSDPSVLKTIPPELRETSDVVDLDDGLALAALGVQWKPASDVFAFSVMESQCKTSITKRKLLSELAKVFDPLGFLSPVTIKAKLIFQDLWKEENVGWDTNLSRNYQVGWQSYQADLSHVQALSIPRVIISPKSIFQEIHGFSDASFKAYSAVVYLRSQDADGKVTLRMIAAKTRVAPVKQVSIPRLELCGSVLVTQLIELIMKSCNFSCPIFAWTDSTLVLKYLAAYPGRWKTFVANRVAKIQDKIPYNNWGYVKSEENPADCASRGITAQELNSHHLWWNGPDWLISTGKPTYPTPSSNTPDKEEKKATTTIAHIQEELWTETTLSRFSSLRILLRFVGSMSRLSLPKEKRKDPLTPTDFKNALHHLIKLIQADEFPHEIAKLKANKQVPPKSKLKQLNPFIAEDGLLRVGGRIQQSSVPNEMKHPIILPHNSHLTTLIIRQCHLDNLHGGFQLVHSTLMRKYWILRGRDTVRHLIRKCVICRKTRARVTTQLMGNLPTARVSPTQPFLHSGVDYAGPYQVLNTSGRGQKTFKCYFAVFVCLSTKAIHLEAVSFLSSEAFIASFTRFAARRGLPAHMYSDCGTNFVGAEKEIQDTVYSKEYNQEVTSNLANIGTTWHFNPPAAPHQGGLWEAGVKAVKYHLRRVVGEHHLTLEEFNTLLCSVEATLNSRPLCAMSPDPTDLDVLTPGHFLIGRPLNSVPEQDVTDLNINRLNRWQKVQQMHQHFWKRWSAEYLTTLQQRFKWTQKRGNTEVGDLVIIREDNLPPSKWKLGRVVTVHPGADNLVRVATVKTATGVYKRPIHKLSQIIPANEISNSN
jgi:hypothetical protein